MNTLSGRMHSATSVISGLIVSIITSTPIIVVTLVTICERLWLSVCVTVSTSFVMRLSTSPCETRSKYASGMRLIFLLMSRRRL